MIDSPLVTRIAAIKRKQRILGYAAAGMVVVFCVAHTVIGWNALNVTTTIIMGILAVVNLRFGYRADA